MISAIWEPTGAPDASAGRDTSWSPRTRDSPRPYDPIHNVPSGSLVKGADVALADAGQPPGIQQRHPLAVEAHHPLGRPHPQAPVGRGQQGVHRRRLGDAGPGGVGVLIEAAARFQGTGRTGQQAPDQ